MKNNNYNIIDDIDISKNNIFHIISRLRDKYNNLLQDELIKNNMNSIASAHAGVIYAIGSAKSGLSMSALASILHRDNSTITTLIDKLIKLNYVYKKKDITDKRTYIVSLSSKGIDSRKKIKIISIKLLKKFYANFNSKEEKALIKLIKKAYINLST